MTKEPDTIAPEARINHQTEDKFGKKYVAAAGKMQKLQPPKMAEKSKQPAGGYDDTPIPRAPPGYTVKFTFHKATNLPFADLNSLSSDPYLVATLKTDAVKRHKQDPDLTWRTPTVRKTTNPDWNSEWIVANVPASGFHLKCRLYDEDPADHDDRLGNVSVRIDSLSEQWSGIDQMAYKIKKRMGSKRAYLFRGCAALFSRDLEMSGDVIISVQVLGKTETDNGGQVYTTGPVQWSRHFSPLIGRLAGTKDSDMEKDGKRVERYNFQAIQIQLQGPVPEHLYHRYVEFKPFVAGMFGATGVRGKILNRALHHQHARIYNYDRNTVYGVYKEPCIELTKQFLDFLHYDQGGRIYTYVLTLDGQFRMTETGKEFGIDLLSKHTMHSDVAAYIACSGEFFLRRLKHPHRVRDKQAPDPQSDALPPAPDPDEEGEDGPQEEPPKDPAMYELIIDNDSGTYRPNAKYLPDLRDFMSRNFPGLKVVTLDCQKDEEKMTKLKDEQRSKKKATGKQMTYLQNVSASSLSSSDEESLENLEDQTGKKGKMQKLKDPKKAFMGALDSAAGPTSANENIENKRKGQQVNEKAQTDSAGQDENTTA